MCRHQKRKELLAHFKIFNNSKNFNMSNSINDEVVLKFAADLSNLKPEFQDLSKLIQDRISETETADKKLKDYGDNLIKQNQTINKTIQANINSLKDEVSIIQELEKATKQFYSKNAKLFDTKNLDEFKKKAENLFKTLSQNIGISFNASDLDALSKELIQAKNDFEATAKVVDFFEKKLKEAGDAGVVSLGQIKAEIEDVKKFISDTEKELKALDKQIDDTAPGKSQAGLMQDREKLNQTIQEAKLNLEALNQEYKTTQSETTKTANAQSALQTELRKVRDEMVRLELEGNKNSDQYDELKQKATQYKKAIEDVNKEIKQSTSDTAGLQNAIGLVNGLMGIYATAQGASALFGTENEALEQTLQKLGGTLAILNGLQATQVELANKQGLSHKALTFIQTQYAIATDASAKATLRLGAALKLLGVGALVGGLAAIVVYWKDIAKWMGITSEESERMADVNKRANELYGEQIAKLTLLNKNIKEGKLNFDQKKKAVKDYNEEFGKTIGSVKDYNELEKKMIDNGEAVIQYLRLKAQAEATYQIALEKTKTLQQDILNLSTGGAVGKLNSMDQFFDKGFRKLYDLLGVDIGKETQLTQSEILNIVGLPTEKEFENAISGMDRWVQGSLKTLRNQQKGVDETLTSANDLDQKFLEIQNRYKIFGDTAESTSKKAVKSTKDWTREIQNLINELVKLQQAYAINMIENDRDREKAILQQQVLDEAKAYADQINSLEVSLAKKKELIDEYNKIYNKETGLAYQSLREQLSQIDREYETKAREAQINALRAINEVNNLGFENQIQDVKNKWNAIRESLRLSIQNTDDEESKNLSNTLLSDSITAEAEELSKKILEINTERLESEKRIADSFVNIWKSANKETEDNDRISKQLLLANELDFQNKLLDLIRSQNPEKTELLNESFHTLITSKNISDYELAGDTLREAFGDDLYHKIIKIAEAIRKINDENASLTSGEKGNINDWFKDTKSFATELGKTLGLEGKELTFFGETVGNAIFQAWGALNQMMEANINEHRNRLMEIEGMISQTESELQREKDLYEQGYANNYDIRKKELEDLKKRKAEEKREMEKAQKQQAAINQASILSNLGVQVSELITAASKVMNGTSGVPFVGVALGLGLVASLFSAMAAFKSQAQSYATFRTGLEQGALNLSGPSHERGGLGLYDSTNGRKVAEYEGGEKLYALNKGQQSKYGWLMDALIDDAKGRTPLMHSLIQKVPVTGKKVIQKVRQVNEITKSAHIKRAEASNENRELLKEIKEFKNAVKEELSGFKHREEGKTEFWEDPMFFYVKTNGVTKKYRK